MATCSWASSSACSTGAGTPAGRAWLAYGEDGRLRLHLRLFGGPGLTPQDEPLDALVFFEVKTPGPGDILADYADELAGWRLDREGPADRAAFAARREEGAGLAYPYTAADPDPLGDALHASPGLTLRPGDLAALVNGKRAMPF